MKDKLSNSVQRNFEKSLLLMIEGNKKQVEGVEIVQNNGLLSFLVNNSNND